MTDLHPSIPRPPRSKSIGRIIPSRTDSGIHIPQKQREKSSNRVQNENREENQQDNIHTHTSQQKIVGYITKRNARDQSNIRNGRNGGGQRGMRDKSTQRMSGTSRARSTNRSVLRDREPQQTRRDTSIQRTGSNTHHPTRKLDPAMKTPNHRAETHLRHTTRSQIKYGVADTPSMQSRGRPRSRSLHNEPSAHIQANAYSEEDDCEDEEDKFDEDYDPNLPACEIVEILWNKLLRLELSRLAQDEVQAKIRKEQEIEAQQSAKILEQLDLELHEIMTCGPIHGQLSLAWEHAQNQQAIQRLLLTQSANPVSDKISTILTQVESLTTVNNECADILESLKECQEISKGWKVSSEAERLWSQEVSNGS